MCVTYFSAYGYLCSCIYVHTSHWYAHTDVFSVVLAAWHTQTHTHALIRHLCMLCCCVRGVAVPTLLMSLVEFNALMELAQLPQAAGNPQAVSYWQQISPWHPGRRERASPLLWVLSALFAPHLHSHSSKTLCVFVCVCLLKWLSVQLQASEHRSSAGTAHREVLSLSSNLNSGPQMNTFCHLFFCLCYWEDVLILYLPFSDCLPLLLSFCTDTDLVYMYGVFLF